MKYTVVVDIDEVVVVDIDEAMIAKIHEVVVVNVDEAIVDVQISTDDSTQHPLYCSSEEDKCEDISV